MGQLAVYPDGYESPSIGKLRQLLKDLNNYLKILGDIGEELPDPAFMNAAMTKPLKKFNKNLEALQKKLKEDNETCRELQDAIIKIKTDFDEEKVLAKFSVLLRRLRQWDSLRGDNSTEEELDDLRIRVRGYFEDFKDELEQAVENRCNPSPN